MAKISKIVGVDAISLFVIKKGRNWYDTGTTPCGFMSELHLENGRFEAWFSYQCKELNHNHL